MRRYHHIGIPTSQSRPGERQIADLDIFVVGHDKSEYGVEWMRIGTNAPVPDLVRQVVHVAFEVSDLASELEGREILIAPNSPSKGVRVAFIVENGAPIELIEFTDRITRIGFKCNAAGGWSSHSPSTDRRFADFRERRGQSVRELNSLERFCDPPHIWHADSRLTSQPT